MNRWKLEAKPAGVRWTDPQWEAISLKGGNILVAAAAGSGKTAVLVERLVRRIVDSSDEAEVDRLLVVTFTKAAAAEMKERIGERIEEELNENPSLYLQRQRQLLHRANISTLHSFCSELIRQHYYEVNVDPKVRIANDTERELLKEEVLDGVLEAYYEASIEEAPIFYEMAESYSNDRSDTGLRKLIFDLYTRSRAHPEPNKWLDYVKKMYEHPYEHPQQSPWGQVVFSYAFEQVHSALGLMKSALAAVHAPEGPPHYLDLFEEEYGRLQQLKSVNTWDELRQQIIGFTWKRVPSKKKGIEFDPAVQARAKTLRDESKKMIGEVEKLLHPNPDDYLDTIQQLHPRVEILVEIVQAFAKEYRETKREKTLMDYDDLEHFALEILSNDSVDQPSAIAKQYQDHFQEVLTDEYQDTNQVQEAILELLSDGNNRFMVGDVKQSIYRFRLAEPGLFIKKHETYATLRQPIEEIERAPGVRIDLSDNFRSREEVLDGVNYVFEQTMDANVGDVTYDDAQSLKYGNVDYVPDVDSYEVELTLLERESEDEDKQPAAELEATWTASKINELIASEYPVFDKEKKEMRPIEYRDITVLMRSLPSAPVYLDIFKHEAIPAYSDRDEGTSDELKFK